MLFGLLGGLFGDITDDTINISFDQSEYDAGTTSLTGTYGYDESLEGWTFNITTDSGTISYSNGNFTVTVTDGFSGTVTVTATNTPPTTEGEREGSDSASAEVKQKEIINLTIDQDVVPYDDESTYDVILTAEVPPGVESSDIEWSFTPTDAGQFIADGPSFPVASAKTMTAKSSSTSENGFFTKKFKFLKNKVVEFIAKIKGTSSQKSTSGTAFKIKSVTVTGGATKNNVTDPTSNDDNWATIKEEGEYVEIYAFSEPTLSADKIQEYITWTGGEEVTGKPLERKVSKSTSQKVHVECKAGSTKDHVDIWIMWANITIHTSGQQPANAVPHVAAYGGGTLGPFHTSSAIGGAMTLEATLTPSGVHNVVKSKWKIKRLRDYMVKEDGIVKENRTNQYDTSLSYWLVLTPTSSDKLYDTDAPHVDIPFQSATSVEYYNNFTQWVEWENTKCSQYATWYLKLKVIRSGSTHNVHFNNIGTGHITFP